jgi:hypothetical protein
MIIDNSKSIQVLQNLFIWGRKLAYDASELKVIQEYFDDSEYIAGLIMRLNLNDRQIHLALSEMASKYGCYFVLEQYKRGFGSDTNSNGGIL